MFTTAKKIEIAASPSFMHGPSACWNPTDRYESMRQVADDLRDVRRKMDHTGVVVARDRSDRRYRLLAGVAIAVLALGAAVAWWMNRPERAAAVSAARARCRAVPRWPVPGWCCAA